MLKLPTMAANAPPMATVSNPVDMRAAEGSSLPQWPTTLYSAIDPMLAGTSTSTNTNTMSARTRKPKGNNSGVTSQGAWIAGLKEIGRKHA